MIALFNLNGTYYAIQDVCSHDDGPVAEGDLEGNEIICPRHGARFDVRTGEVLSLPAAVDIPAYPVRVEGEEILIGMPREE
jgi:3-phenylpropionate/trans-cinnamate dioxygenase ferredoxin subunit